MTLSHPSEAFYVTGGTLRADAPSYVERRADQELRDALLRGDFCYVLTARQMGKSSLMVRTADRLRQQEVHVVVLDLTALGQNLTIAQWYRGLALRMGQQLGIEEEIEDYWISQQEASPLQRFLSALEKVVLPLLSGRIVFFLDEIDIVRSLPFPTDEFFAAIRSCYNRRAVDPVFSRLTFCLLGVATPADLIADVRTTPFNIGRRIELDDFTMSEAVLLAKGLSAPRRNGVKLMRRVLFWTGGHPYLTQHLCQEIEAQPTVSSSKEVDALCNSLFLKQTARETNDNLTFVRNSLLKSTVDRVSLLDRYLSICTRSQKVRPDETDPVLSALRLSGIVRTTNGFLRVRNEIYSHVFDRKWIQSHMPGAELRRQQLAFRKGVLRATGAVASVLGVLCVGIFGVTLWIDHSPDLDIPKMVPKSRNASDGYDEAISNIINRNEILHAIAEDVPTKLRYSISEQQEVVLKNRKALNTLRESFASDYWPPRHSIRLTNGRTRFWGYHDLHNLLLLEADIYLAQGKWAAAANSYVDALRLATDSSRIGKPTNNRMFLFYDPQVRLWITIDHLNANEATVAARRLESILKKSISFGGYLQETRSVVLENWQDEFRRPDWRERRKIWFDSEQGEEKETNDWTRWKRHTQIRLLSKKQIIYLVNKQYGLWISFSNHPFGDNLAQYYGDKNHRFEVIKPNVPSIAGMVPKTEYRNEWLADALNKTHCTFLITALALQAYRRDRGNYPKTLMQLVPQYLTETPRDPFGYNLFQHTESLFYQRKGAGYLLYSMGPDRKDDGGKSILKPFITQAERASTYNEVTFGSKGDITVENSGLAASKQARNRVPNKNASRN